MDTLHPVNAVNGAPAYSGRMLRQVGSVAFAMGSAARMFGVRSGVRPGTWTGTVSATATTWSCNPFAGVIDAEAAIEAGAYTFAFDGVATGAVTPANASYPRTDIIYVQIDDPSEGDGSAVPAATRKYLAGTAGAGAPIPATPARSMVVARINVPVSGGGSPSVTWVAPAAVAAGATIPFKSVAERDEWAGASDGASCRVPSNNGWIDFVYEAGVGWQVSGSTVPRTFLGLFNDASYNNLQLIGNVILLPNIPVATRVLVTLTGLIGFSGTAAASFGTNAVATGGTIVADVQGNTGAYIHAAAQRVSYTHEFVVDVPANVPATVSCTMSTATTSAYFKGMLTARVLLPGEY